MNALTKITLRNIKLNRKRAWVTIIGIMLATALIVVVADMAESFRSSMVEYEKAHSGDYHYCFYDVDPENLKYFEGNRNIEKLGYSVDLGYTELTGSRNEKKPYLYLKAMDESAMQVANVTLTEGRLPENDHEIVISDSIRTNGGVEYRVGDTIRLTNSNREDAKGNEEDQSCEYTEGEQLTDSGKAAGEYTVVGIMERLMRSQEPYYAPGYTVITRITDVTQYSDITVYASYTKAGLKRREEVTAGLLKLSPEIYQKYQNGEPLNEEEQQQLEESQKIASYVTCNIWLLKYQMMLFSDGSLKMLYSMAGIAIVIIIVTSVFCIRNSFVISLTEKLHLYGMLSSIGATGKQRKKLIYGEALILGAVGIPLGILLGLLAGWLVVKGTGHLMQSSLQVTLAYVISWPAILVSIVLAVITILLSAGQSAGKAAKISPIQAIRGNDTIRISRKEIRMPKWLSRLFGIGGTIAYKNLKRARVKYRTTIISIVVSVAVFIGMSSFMSVAMKIADTYYTDSSYQLMVPLNGKDQMENARKILNLDGVKEAEICQRDYISVPVDEVKYSKQYQTLMGNTGEEDYSDETFMIVALNPEAFQAYAKKLGCTVKDGNSQAILISDVTKTVMQNGEEKYMTGELYDYQTGDVIQGTMEMSDTPISVQIIKTTTERPMSVENIGGVGMLIVSNTELTDYQKEMIDRLEVYIHCEDPDGLQKVIEDDMEFVNFNVVNLKQSYDATKSLFTLIGVFLYGFIIVIALIGITNIFNTITTNMELRSREFATLKSIGMTRREFRRIIWLESVFYGVKSLLIGIPAGILLSVGFHMAMGTNLETAYHLPWTGILISIGAVFVLLFGIMRYSMGRINRKNIIETIQSENI
ncbi:MAG: ABC transporter permease [Clostridium sp.]|nr:ABC transporter permease [Clostridium sp.]